jgi:hypothetical protein
MNETGGTTVVDSSGNGYNGTSQRDCSLLTTAGKIGNALHFDGTNDYVDIPYTAFNAPFSISMWVNLDDGQPDDMPSSENAIFGVLGSASSGIEIWNYSDGTGKGYLPFHWKGGTKNVDYIGTDNLLPDGSTGWFHVVVIIYTDGGRVKGQLYFNNSLITTKIGSLGDMSGYNVTDHPYIGACNEVGVYKAAGAIDDVCIFNKALSTDEIAFLYNGGNGTEDLYGSGVIMDDFFADQWAW